MKGRIHSFETLGAVDGPGLRFVIFMQGCNLRCKYCQNRDTWDLKAGKEYEVEELIEIILKYKNYIGSAGGVTVSGGEPLLQVDFIIKLFKELRRNKIHTCIDTSGNFSINDEIRELIDLTDLFLLDIKCISNEKCIELTGMSNTNSLAFAKYLSDNNKKMWIRQVLIPTITDNEIDLVELKNFIKTLKGVEKVEILKYHDLGKFKWNDLKIKYPLDNIRVANDEDYKRALKILEIE